MRMYLVQVCFRATCNAEGQKLSRGEELTRAIALVTSGGLKARAEEAEAVLQAKGYSDAEVTLLTDRGYVYVSEARPGSGS